MTRARQSAAWDHTAMLLAKINNLFCGPSSPGFIADPCVLNPFRKQQRGQRMTLKELRGSMSDAKYR